MLTRVQLPASLPAKGSTDPDTVDSLETLMGNITMSIVPRRLLSCSLTRPTRHQPPDLPPHQSLAPPPLHKVPQINSPLRLPHTRQLALKRMHPKHKPRHIEIPEDTPTLPTHDTPVPYLRAARVCVHLAQLQLRCCADALREECISGKGAEGLAARFVSVGGRGMW